MKFAVLAVLSAPILVSAQGYGGPASSSAPSSASAAAAPAPSDPPNVHRINLAVNLAFAFSPSNVTAKKGDTIVFDTPPNGGFQHSISESNFSNPCSPLPGGFNSGLLDNNMEFNLTITDDTQPIWFFCEQTNPLKHCGSGMVGAINPPSTGHTIDAYIAAAKSIGNNEAAQTPTTALTGIGAMATAPAAAVTAAAPAATKTSGAERITAGAGSLLAALFGLFALA